MAKTKQRPPASARPKRRAKLVNVRISPQKLNLVAQSIRGLPVQKALNELEFSRKRIANDVRKVLYSADLERREQPQPRHRQPGRRRGLRGQEPGDEAFREPALVAARRASESRFARSPSWSAKLGEAA